MRAPELNARGLLNCVNQNLTLISASTDIKRQHAIIVSHHSVLALEHSLDGSALNVVQSGLLVGGSRLLILAGFLGVQLAIDNSQLLGQLEISLRKQ